MASAADPDVWGGAPEGVPMPASEQRQQPTMEQGLAEEKQGMTPRGTRKVRKKRPKKVVADRAKQETPVLNVDDQPVGGGGGGGYSNFDEQPVGGGGGGRSNFDEQPVGGGSGMYNVDDMPVGMSSSTQAFKSGSSMPDIPEQAFTLLPLTSP